MILAESGRLTLLLGSTVDRIEPDGVVIRTAEETTRIRNDAVIICAGGILPTQFLESVGIRVETKYGTA